MKSLHAFLFAFTLATCPVHFNLLDLIISIIFDESTNYEFLRYAILSSVLSFPSFQIHTYTWEPCARIPSVHIPPLIWGPKFRVHTQQHSTQELVQYYIQMITPCLLVLEDTFQTIADFSTKELAWRDWTRGDALDFCSSLHGTSAILIEVSSDFPQLLRANYGVVFQLGYSLFLSSSFQFIIHFSSIIRHYMISIQRRQITYRKRERNLLHQLTGMKTKEHQCRQRNARHWDEGSVLKKGYRQELRVEGLGAGN
jgi:hypothetical protein